MSVIWGRSFFCAPHAVELKFKELQALAFLLGEINRPPLAIRDCAVCAPFRFSRGGVLEQFCAQHPKAAQCTECAGSGKVLA